MCGMNNSRKIFSDELNNWLVDVVDLKQSQFQMYIYHKFTPYGSELVVLSYVDDFVFWYTYEELGKWFLGKLGKSLYVSFLVYSYWFMFIGISQINEYSI